MTYGMILVGILLPALVSLWGTKAVRNYALRTSMIDVPNHRSSHQVPTPRGGGFAIVAGVLGAISVLTLLFPDQRSTALGLLGSGLLIASVGLLDDRFELSARVRLLVQGVSAVWLLAWVGGVGTYSWYGADLTIPALAVAALFIVWSTNLYNFMDGLDGFAGSQALVAAMVAAFLCLRAGDPLLGYTMLATAGAAAGFLVWNWPPAKIFMGDCGSGFLGFLFAATAIAAHRNGSMSMSASLTLLLVFLMDATFTLLRRIVQGERWHQAHRTHAYQLATQMGASHKQVTVVSLGLFCTAAAVTACLELQIRGATMLAVGFGSCLAGIWLAINWLFVGRTQILASINRRNEEASRDFQVDASSAAKGYLHYTRFKSRLRSWRSIMPKNDLLAEATGVASRLGYTVSHDWLDGCGGGHIEAAGEKWILLDFNMTRRDQIRQILLTIQHEAEQLDSLSDDLRLALREAATGTIEASVNRAA